MVRFLKHIPLFLISIAVVSASTLDSVIDRGSLRVGLTGEQPPFAMVDLRGELMGAEIDLARAIGGMLEVEVEFIQMPFSDLLPAIDAGTVDVVLSGMTINAERSANFAFAGPYFVSGKTILIKEENQTEIQEAAALNSADLTITVLAESTSEIFVRNNMPDAQLLPTSSYEEAVKAVIDEQADLLVADMPICIVTAMRYPEERLRVHPRPFTIEPIGIALDDADPRFVRLLDQYLDALERGGFLRQLEKKWLRSGDWISRLQ